MAENDTSFRAEHVDEQLAERQQQLAEYSRPERAPAGLRLIADLQDLYPPTPDVAETLERVWWRMEQHRRKAAPSLRSSAPLHSQAAQHARRRALNAEILRFRRQGRLTRVGSLVAAVLLLVVMGGLVTGLVLVRQKGTPGTAGQPTSTNTTQVGSNLYLSDYTGISKLDPSTGKVLWHLPLAGSYAAPAVVKGVVYGSALGGLVVALDAKTGKRLWSYDRKDQGASSVTPAVVDGVVYVGGSNAGRVFALNARDGSERWVAQVAESDERNSVMISDVVAANGVVYGNLTYEQGQSHSALFALNASNGTLRWQMPALTDQIAVGAPVLANGVLLVASAHRGHLQPGQIAQSYGAAFTTDGKLFWRSNPLAGQVGVGPVVTQGVAYLNDPNGSLYALSASSGQELWHSALKMSLAPVPEVAEGSLYLSQTASTGSGPKHILALNASDHAVRWQRSLGAASGTALAVIKDILYVSTDQGVLYALKTSDGSVLWHSTYEDANQSPYESRLAVAP